MKTIPVNDWRWKLANVPAKGALAPEYASEFDDSTWNTIKPKTDGDTGDQVLSEGQTAVFRAHVNLTEADLANPGVQVRFGGIDDHGWIFVNNQRVGESHRLGGATGLRHQESAARGRQCHRRGRIE